MQGVPTRFKTVARPAEYIYSGHNGGELLRRESDAWAHRFPESGDDLHQEGLRALAVAIDLFRERQIRRDTLGMIFSISVDGSSMIMDDITRFVRRGGTTLDPWHKAFDFMRHRAEEQMEDIARFFPKMAA